VVLLREALVRILTKKSDMGVVDAAPYSRDALEQIEALTRALFSSTQFFLKPDLRPVCMSRFPGVESP